MGRYYLLSEVNQKGKVNVILEVISLRRLSDFDVSKVFPIPTNELINIEYQATSKGTINYAVFDITGRLVAQQKSSAVEGLNSIVLDVSNYVTGTYFIQLNDGVQKMVTRLVKN